MLSRAVVAPSRPGVRTSQSWSIHCCRTFRGCSRSKRRVVQRQSLRSGHCKSGMDGEAIFFHGAGRGKAKNLWGLIVITICITIIIIISIIITISIITSIIAIVTNSTKDDILDMEELFYMLTNFREQSLRPCKQKKKKVLSLFTVPCISY